jgi:hypothetical protein
LPTVNQSKQIGFKEESKAQTRLTQLKEDNIIFMKRILINTTERREKPRTGSDKKNECARTYPADQFPEKRSRHTTQSRRQGVDKRHPC